MQTTQGCCVCFFFFVFFFFYQNLEAASHRTAVLWPLTFHLTNHLNETKEIYRSLPEKPSSKATFSSGLLHMDTLILADQQNLHLRALYEHLMSRKGAMGDRDGWWEKSQKNVSILMMMMIIIIIIMLKFEWVACIVPKSRCQAWVTI